MRALAMLVGPFYIGIGLFVWALIMDWSTAITAGAGMFFFMFTVHIVGKNNLRNKVLLWKKGEEE